MLWRIAFIITYQHPQVQVIYWVYMNIYFSGIGGVALGPLAEIAQDAGHTIQGSDPTESLTTIELAKRGITVSNEQKGVFLKKVHDALPIDWLVYTSALPEDHPELAFARQLGIKTTKRDELIAHLIKEKNLKLIAVAGTHGKTNTTAMLVWAFQQLGIPVSYSVGTTLSFGPSGKYDPKSEYFIYECDEFDRNFLHFHPYLSLIMSLDYDHPDTYGTPDDYMAAFRQFIDQSDTTIMWQSDGKLVDASPQDGILVAKNDVAAVTIPGELNRRNATLVLKALDRLAIPGDHLAALNSFPGSQRRFEKLAPNLYTDYGHHPTEIAATLQVAREINDNVVLVYQPHQNVRQHEIKNQYTDCFELADSVYWLPTYLSREDPSLPILTAEDLTEHVTDIDAIYSAEMDDELWEAIQQARDQGKLVLFMGAGTIDEWVRKQCATAHVINLLIIDKEGNFVLKRTDEKRLALFSGTVDLLREDSLLAAAVHALSEQTGITATSDDLGYFKLYSRTLDGQDTESYVAVYTLGYADITGLQATHADQFETVSPNALGEFPLTIYARTTVTEYAHPNAEV